MFGLYAGFVYLTPLFGGLLADRVLGRTKTVVIGAILMALGHFLMAFEASFLVALACLLLGVGCFKGNIAAQVGDLYAPGDPRRASAFQIFLLAVQIAVIARAHRLRHARREGGLALGLRRRRRRHADRPDVYLAGRRWLPPEPGRRSGDAGAPAPRPAMTRRREGAPVLLSRCSRC